MYWKFYQGFKASKGDPDAEKNVKKVVGLIASFCLFAMILFIVMGLWTQWSASLSKGKIERLVE